jgi:hypothetical protein
VLIGHIAQALRSALNAKAQLVMTVEFPLMTLETVPSETPAVCAIWCIVIRPPGVLGLSGFFFIRAVRVSQDSRLKRRESEPRAFVNSRYQNKACYFKRVVLPSQI